MNTYKHTYTCTCKQDGVYNFVRHREHKNLKAIPKHFHFPTKYSATN